MQSSNRTLLQIALAVTGVCLALCICGGLFVGGGIYLNRFVVRTSPTPTVAILSARTPVPTSAVDTANAVLNADVPVADPRELTGRLKGIANIPVVVRETPKLYNVGDEEVFWVSNTETDKQFQITAVLKYQTPHVYMWVEKGQNVSQSNIEAAANLFENKTYPTDREFFGSEWTPGVDSDPHLFVLHAHDLGSTTQGYYSSVDEYSHLVNKYSNEHEMFYISLDASCDTCLSPVNSAYYNGALAHEFQHMIHWHNDPNEELWMNEGSSVLAQFLNGADLGNSPSDYLHQPDTQLNTWEEGSAGFNSRHYGAGFLFMLYFLDHFGEDATRQLIADQENGIVSVDDVLKRTGQKVSFDDVFASWTVANYLDDPSLADGQYGYKNFDAVAAKLDKSYDSLQLNNGVGPVRTTVHQYGADYIKLRGNHAVNVHFEGSTSVKVLNADAHSGRYFWWSNRADDSDTTLTREFDLSAVKTATLRFWTWYDLEADWDYAYVEASTDGGAHWQILKTLSGTDSNPNGGSYGWAFTGRSGGQDTSEWIQEQVDLAPYAGKKVQVRFEMITDAAVNQPGLALDDMHIDEINWRDDAETADSGWDARGWVRLDNLLPEHFDVQVIEKGAGGTTVRHLPLAADQSGDWTIDLGGTVDEAVLVISAAAPKTTEVAAYEYTIAKR